jgi:hypothetical protein
MDQDSQSLQQAPPLKGKRGSSTFWDRVEALGETMEFGLRALRGCIFGFLLSGIAWILGSQVWVGVGVLLAISVAPFAFVIGVFWDEVKLLLWVLRKLFTGW